MKQFLILLAIFFHGSLLFAQKMNGVVGQSKINIVCTPPTIMRLGQSIQLKVKVKHSFAQEKTGQLTLSLINSKTKKSVDGWFVNIFPFQYFTTIKMETFETEFPFTVPFDYVGKFDIEIVARVNEIKDSLHVSISTKK